MNLFGKAGHMFQAILPWPTRAQRRQAIDAARIGRIDAERRAAQAKAAQRQLQKHVNANHIAQAIAEQIRRTR